jgi:hypothetical protein
MRRLSQQLLSAVFAIALLSPAVIITGCSAHVGVGYRVYDPGYGDYHVWDANEAAYYTRWEGETHRPHADFRKRPAPEQKEYFTWRHNQH